MKKINLPAVHDKDLVKILTEYNLIHQFEKSELNCFNCNQIINSINLSGIIVKYETLAFVCDNPDCLAHATSKNTKNI